MTSIPMTTDYVDVKLKMGSYEFTNEDLQIDSIKISNGCYDGSVFGIGNVYIKNANITMNYYKFIGKDLHIEILFQYQGAWISFGEFVVTETPVISGDKISVSLESVLSTKASYGVVFDDVLQEYTIRQIKKKVEEITGRTIVFVPELSTDEEESFLDGKSACFLKDINNYVDGKPIYTEVSVRDMISGIAILFGGNAYEDTNNRIVIKQKTYLKNEDKYVSSDYLDSNYKYSQEIYAIKSISLLFLPWSLGLFNPPNASGRICTVNYLGEDKVSNTLLATQSSMAGKTPYDYSINCDWIGWTSDGSTFDTRVTPGGRASACLRQGDLMYRTCDMTFVGIDFGWNIAPGNLVKVKVPELEDPIDVLCGEISYEWDGGFTTNISCNCNIESNGSYSTEVSTQASAAAAQEGRQTSLELNYANITLSNIEDSTIRGSIFKDGTIEGSKIKESTITGSLIANSTIKGSNIEEGTITGSNIKAATITGALIVDGTIRGNHIMESSIDGSKIEDSAITESKISNSSITNSKIKDGEIENSKIKDATLTGAKIKDATIGFAKVDSSFIKDLTADKAYIENLKASIANIGYLTADEADIKYATISSLEVVDGKIDNLETIAITTNNLSAKVADLGYLNADTADLKYANIELSNIDVANVGTFFANVGLIDRATIVDGHVTGFLDSVEVNANKITAGTLVADRILLKGSENGLLYALNNLGELTSTTVDTLDGYVLTDRTINADKIVASSITANELDVDDIFADSAVIEKIFAQDITATGIIRGATLVGASVSADRGTIGGFGIWDNWLVGSYDDDTYHYQVDLNTDKTYGTKNGAYAIYARKDNISTNKSESEWYVTYDGYMHAENGEIAGFKFDKNGFTKESIDETVSLICYDNMTGGGLTINTNGLRHFTANSSGIEVSLKDSITEYKAELSVTAYGFQFTDKFPEEIAPRVPIELSIGQGRKYDGTYVHDPYFRINVPTEISEKLNVSAEVNLRDILHVNETVVSEKPITVESSSSKGKTVISNGLIGLDDMQGGTVRYFIDNTYENLRIWDTKVGERLLFSSNSIIFKPKGATVLFINETKAVENGYEIIGCTVTTSGNFTCKKYRDGRLVIEYRFKNTSNVSLSNKVETYYAAGSAGTFPIAFTDVPAVMSGIAISDLSAPFCNVTFESVTKTGFGRYIIWTLPTISGYVIPSGSVVSATFTGRWK